MAMKDFPMPSAEGEALPPEAMSAEAAPAADLTSFSDEDLLKELESRGYTVESPKEKAAQNKSPEEEAAKDEVMV